MIQHCKLVQILLSLLLSSAHVFASPEPDVLQQNTASSHQQMRQAVQERGTVRVIARYKATNTRSSSHSLRATDRVKAFIKKQNITSIKSLKHRSLEVYSVDPGQLDKLLDSGLFDDIQEDRLNKPVLLESVPLIAGDVAHNSGLTGNGAVVAILDTGVDASHDAFGGRVVKEACFSTNDPNNGTSSLCPNGREFETGTGAAAPCDTLCSHGTHVASIAAGQEAGRPGVAYDAGIIAVQVFSLFTSEAYCGSGYAPCVLAYDSDIIEGLDYVESLSETYNIAAVNLSLGSGQYFATCDNSYYSSTFASLANANILATVASGNNGYENAISRPACSPGAFSVGSVADTTGAVSPWSNSAYFLSILAPGSFIRSAIPGGGYSILSGTSMAAPHVAGAAALIRANSPSISLAEMKSLLTAQATPVLDPRNALTFPRLDLGMVTSALVGLAQAPSVTIGSPADGAIIATDEGAISLTATATDVQDGDLSNSVSWSSTTDGVLVTPAQLSAGQHEIRASVTDSDGFSNVASVEVTIVNKPSVQIMLPVAGMSLTQGQSLVLTAEATDVEDGDTSSSINWSSSLDGALGTGATISTNLATAGIHVITATVIDDDGHSPTSDPTIEVEILIDTDGDGVTDETDNCPFVANPDQTDLNGDGVGLLCTVIGC